MSDLIQLQKRRYAMKYRLRRQIRDRDGRDMTFTFYFKYRQGGQIKHGEFDVVMNLRVKDKSRIGYDVRNTIEQIQAGMIPVRANFGVFDDFNDMYGGDWEPHEGVVDYGIIHDETP